MHSREQDNPQKVSPKRKELERQDSISSSQISQSSMPYASNQEQQKAQVLNKSNKKIVEGARQSSLQPRNQQKEARPVIPQQKKSAEPEQQRQQSVFSPHPPPLKEKKNTPRELAVAVPTVEELPQEDLQLPINQQQPIEPNQVNSVPHPQQATPVGVRIGRIYEFTRQPEREGVRIYLPHIVDQPPLQLCDVFQGISSSESYRFGEDDSFSSVNRIILGLNSRLEDYQSTHVSLGLNQFDTPLREYVMRKLTPEENSVSVLVEQGYSISDIEPLPIVSSQGAISNQEDLEPPDEELLLIAQSNLFATQDKAITEMNNLEFMRICQFMDGSHNSSFSNVWQLHISRDQSSIESGSDQGDSSLHYSSFMHEYGYLENTRLHLSD